MTTNAIMNKEVKLGHQDVTSLESFRPNRGAQPIGLVQQTSPYPSFIQGGKVEAGKSDSANSTLPQLVQRAGNASQTINQAQPNLNLLQ